MKKVILYHPKTHHEKNYKFYWIPYSLLSISSMIIENGIQVKIIDGNVEDFNNYDFSDKDIVCFGISVMIGYQITDAIEICKKIRKESNSPIVWGGPLPSVLPNLVLRSNYPDYILRGAGDISFYELVKAVIDNDKFKDSVGYRDKEIYEGKVQIIKNRDELPLYHYELVNVENYIQNDPLISDRVINYISSQGCPFQCGFCTEVAIYQSSWSGFNNERIIREVEFLYKTYNVNGIKFYDSNFFVNKQRVLKFAEDVLNRKISIKWAASAHPNNLLKFTKDELNYLKKSGLCRLLIGAESGVQDELDFVKKGLRINDISKVSKILFEVGIRASFTFITGYPTFPTENINKTLSFANSLALEYRNHEFKVHMYLPFPGTPLYKLAVRNGFHEPNTLEEWSNLDYYEVCNPWVDEICSKKIREFNTKFCPYVL